MSTKAKLTDALCESEGLDEHELLDIYAYESVVPGVCMQTDCLNVQFVEPDSGDGCCDACGCNTIISCLRLWGYV